MEAFTHRINLSGKQARYYDLGSLNPSVAAEHNKSAPAHFYGGNSFTVGTYTPLLHELAATFDISALALRGYWYDKPQKRRLTREQDAELLIEFLERTQIGLWWVSVIRKVPLPPPWPPPNVQIYSPSCI